MATGKIEKQITSTKRELNPGNPVTSGNWALTDFEKTASVLFINTFRYGQCNAVAFTPDTDASDSNNVIPGTRANVKYKYDRDAKKFYLVSSPDAVFVSIAAIK